MKCICTGLAEYPYIPNPDCSIHGAGFKQLNERSKLMSKQWEFYIAGVQFHEAKKVLNKMQVRDVLMIKPEPTNKYDPNAVGLIFEDVDEDYNIENVMLGYVPKKFSSEVSAFLELNENVICELTEVNKDKKPWEQLKVVIKAAEEEVEEDFTEDDFDDFDEDDFDDIPEEVA